MSNVIGFLENVGRSAVLRHASREQLLEAMRSGSVSPSLQNAMLDLEGQNIGALIGAREIMYCALFPEKLPKKAPAKKPVKAPPKKAPAKKPAKKAPARPKRK